MVKKICSVPITDEQEQIILGTVLGDAYISKFPNRTHSNLLIAHSTKDEDYLKWKHEKLESICSEKSVYIRNNSGYGLGHKLIWLRTRVHPFITNLRNIFYPNGEKIVPEEELYKLDELGLAVWFMDDGTLSVRDVGSPRYILSTYGFSLGEHKMMRDYFSDRWGVTPSIIKRNYKNKPTKHFLSFGVDDTQKLGDIMRPFILDCMSRKRMEMS